MATASKPRMALGLDGLHRKSELSLTCFRLLMDDLPSAPDAAATLSTEAQPMEGVLPIGSPLSGQADEPASGPSLQPALLHIFSDAPLRWKKAARSHSVSNQASIHSSPSLPIGMH